MKYRLVLVLFSLTFTLHPVCRADESQTNSKPWKSLKNANGWSVSFPTTWEAYGSKFGPEEDTTVVIHGPAGCFKNGLRCGSFQISTRPYLDMGKGSQEFEREMRTLSSHQSNSNGKQNVTIDGIPGYEETRYSTGDEANRIGRVHKDIYLGYRGVCSIVYSEDFKDRSEIKSPEDWKLTSTFKKIFSTLKFSKK